MRLAMSVKYITCKCDKRSVTSEDTSYAHVTIMSEERKTIRKRRETEAKREREGLVSSFSVSLLLVMTEENAMKDNRPRRLQFLCCFFFFFFSLLLVREWREASSSASSFSVRDCRQRERERKWKMGRETFLYAIVDFVHRSDRVLLYK